MTRGFDKQALMDQPIPVVSEWEQRGARIRAKRRAVMDQWDRSELALVLDMLDLSDGRSA